MMPGAGFERHAAGAPSAAAFDAGEKLAVLNDQPQRIVARRTPGAEDLRDAFVRQRVNMKANGDRKVAGTFLNSASLRSSS